MEREVGREVPAFVVAAQEIDAVWVAEFEAVEVEQALRRISGEGNDI